MDDELIAISEEIFKDIIAKLTLQLRFLDPALNRYVFVPDSLAFSCDGLYFHYSPITVIKMYRNDPNALTRGYLHVLLHSIFQHSSFAGNRTMSLWDLACDIAVEDVILSLGLACTQSGNDEEKRRRIALLKEQTGELTAQRLYHVLENTDRDMLRWMRELFTFDRHECWYELRNVTGSKDVLFGDEVKDDQANAGMNRFDKASHDTGERQEGENADAQDETIEQIRNALKDWQEISEKIETDLETFSKEYGDRLDTLVQSLKKLHRQKYDYSTFLRKFMHTGEKIMVNDEDFDTVFYTYGLRLYGNLPLIEALEYKEAPSIKELVIAIDTSGSVQGDIVQGFLQKTYNLFCQRELFFSRIRVHILQCDMIIRDAAVITSPQTFETYIQNVEIKGLGGTDFRPVFNYITDHIRDGEFRKLGGLLYFTDGDGVYPKVPPSWKTAFVFPSGNKEITVPSWAIKYVMEDEE